MRYFYILHIILLTAVVSVIHSSEESNYFLDARSKAAVLTLTINGKTFVMDSMKEEEKYSTSSALIDLYLQSGPNEIEVFYDRKDDMEKKVEQSFR